MSKNIDKLKDRLRELRLSKKLNQEELANALNISKSTIAMWETGSRFPAPEGIEAIADYFNVDVDYLYGRSNIKRKVIYDEFGNEYKNARATGIKIKVLGRVAAGIPIEAVEDIIDTEEISEEMASTGEFFGLKIKGDSMEPRICDGDVVIVRQQNDADSGDIVIALVNGDDATCKRLTKYAGGIGLISLNAKYEPMMFSEDDIKDKPVKIIGKVVELRGKL